MGRRLSPTLAGLGFAVALIWFGVGAPRREAAVAPDVAPLVADVDARIREAIAAVQARAETLGQLPRLGVAVATDGQTVRDLTSDELAFRTRPGEHIEIAQVARHDGRDGAARSLLRLPDDQLPLPMASTGIHLEIVGGQLQVVSVVSLPARERGDQLRGALAVAQAVDLSPFAARFGAVGLQAKLDVGERSVALATGGMPTGSPERTLALATAAAEPAHLAIFGRGSTVAGPGSSRPLFGPLAALVAGIGAALAMRKRGATNSPPPAPGTFAGPDAPAPAFAGPPESDDATPVPLLVDASAVSGPSSRPTSDPSGRPANRRRPTTSTLPSQMFEVRGDDGPTTAVGPHNDDALDKEYRALFEEFTNMRRTCREPIENLDADLFVAALRRQRDELMQAHAGREIRFRLAFDNGKAAIRYVLA